MTRLRIGVVSPEFPPQIGGVETYAYEYTRALAARGHEVTVFTRPQREGQAALPGVTVVPRLLRRRDHDRRVLAGAPVDTWHVMNAAYAWVALEHAPVVVSVHGNDFLRPYIPVGRADLGRRLGLSRSPAWLEQADHGVGRWRVRRWLHQGLARAGRILTNSRYTEKVLLEHFPQCRGQTTVGLVGVPPAFLTTAPAPEPDAGAPARLVTVARLSEPRKNVDRVLRALAALAGRHDFRYTVIGDGALRPELEALARDLGIAERVCFAGRVSGEDLRRHLSAADLFVLASAVLPHSHEGFGIAYLEANACGTPVIAARLAGAAEAVREGVSGLLVDEPDEDSIQVALERVLCGAVRFDREACRAFAAGFTWDRVVEQALPYYQDTRRAAS